MTGAQFHPRARQEFDAASDWYAERSVRASLAFIDEVESAVARIVAEPFTYAAWKAAGDKTIRMCVLPQFPFTIVYLAEPKPIFIIAVAHAKRRPGYWSRRKRK